MEKGVLTIPPEAEKAGRVRDELRRAGLPPQAVALLAEQSARQKVLLKAAIQDETRERAGRRRTRRS